MEGIFMGKKKEEENPAAQKTEEPVEYMAEEQGMEGLSVEKQRRKQPENLGTVYYPRGGRLCAASTPPLSFQTWSRSSPTITETMRMKENLKQTNKLSLLKFKV